MVSSFSILEDLIGNGDSKEIGATKFIRLVISLLGYEVLQANDLFQSRYSLVSTAREICEEIERSIEEVGREEDQSKAWTKFMVYHAKVDTLETKLLELHPVLAEHSLEVKPVLSVEQRSQTVDAWLVQRDKLKLWLGILQALHGGKKVSVWEQQHDDIGQLSSILDIIEISEPIHARRFTENLRSFVADFQPSEEEDETAMVYAIKGAWMLQAVIEIANNSNDKDTRRHMKSKKVWTAAEELSREINSVTEDIERFYNDFEAALEVLIDPGDKSYLALLHGSRGVSRPFIHQNMTIVTFCRELLLHYNNETEIAKKQLDEHIIERAFQASLNVTTTAAAANIISPQGLNNKEYVVTDMKERVVVAQLALEAGFNQYQEPEKITTLRGELAKAFEKDLNEWNKIKEMYKGPKNAPVESLEVVVTIRSENEPNDEVKVPGSTTIGALLWRKEYRAGKETRSIAGFCLPGSPGVPLAPNTAIEKLSNGRPSLILCEIIDRPGTPDSSPSTPSSMGFGLFD